jgi:uncharacterized membrane protein YphA (DoxX/SURF4 family)
MNLLNKFSNWGDHHHPALLDCLRILLGIFLLLKGIAFMQNTAFLRDILIQQKTISFSTVELSIIIRYVTFIHMVGGLLIALGILTRLSCLLQLPVLIAAFFMLDMFKSPLNSDLWLTIITSFLLIIFLITGSGPLSLDRFLKDI